MPKVTVVLPTLEQSHFIRRALDSLLAQELTEWELVIVDDGSQDDTARAVLPYLADPRIRCVNLLHNQGLGHAVNVGLERARAPLIACLPSDDVFYPEHLRRLCAALDDAPAASLAFSGLRHQHSRSAVGPVEGYCLQLVQCMHRQTAGRWIERAELESDDQERRFCSKLRAHGAFFGVGEASCKWVDHPGQRRKRMQEPVGGINPFRRHYRVQEPLRFHTTTGNAIDEAAQYAAMRERPATASGPGALTILLVGELAYNAERVLALDEQGHTLYGLWMDDPYWYNTVGPLPFGHVRDLPREGWVDAVRSLRPDVIYAQLNWQAVPFCHQVLIATPGISFVWHCKEGPFICMEKGTWPQLIELYQDADGRIFSSPEMRDWFDTVTLSLSSSRPCHVLDGDLPKQDWFGQPPQALLSATCGDVHTVVPGRPIGLHPRTVQALAHEGVHLHFYGDFTHGQWRDSIAKARTLAPQHLHLHANVGQEHRVEEFSRYDAGWLHAFFSDNRGQIRRANWDDLNYPARMATLAQAGLPMIARRNEGAIVATQNLARELDVGLFYDSVEELAACLRDTPRRVALRHSVGRSRHRFTFDHHAPALVNFFRTVIDHASRFPAPARSAA